MIDLFPLLLILHFVGLIAALGGGIGLSQVGRKLASPSEAELPLLLTLQRSFNAFMLVGFALLLITGPLMLFSRFGGGAGLPFWFSLKMTAVALAVIAAATSQVAKRRFRAGRTGALKWMLVTGPMTGILMLFAVIFAVLTFQ
jgi:hypothetical protein